MIDRLLAIVALVLLNGYFVGAEFALVRSRATRLEAMAAEGDRLAGLALRATANIPALLSASQLGVTLASLGLGWVAESTVASMMINLVGTLAPATDAALRLTVGSTVALAGVTYLHVVFGELAPKGAALQHPEVLARWLIPPLIVFSIITRPFTGLLAISAQLVLRLFGQHPEDAEDSNVHSPEEIRLLVEQSEEHGAMETQDADLINAVFEFAETSAREVMTPRKDIAAIRASATFDETLRTLVERGFSRYPVYTDTIDHIVGVLLVKDLLPFTHNAPADFTAASIMRPVHIIPGTREVEDVLTDFKRLKEHLAIVVDEAGLTAGLVTMEDLLEEIVGEILDEYDDAEPPPQPRRRQRPSRPTNTITASAKDTSTVS